MDDQFSRTDLVRKEALTQAILWAAHRAVPQTLAETLQDAEVIERWLLTAPSAPDAPVPGELIVLQPHETHLDAARRRRGWPPLTARPGETVGEALARDAAAEDLRPSTGVEHWEELKRLDNLLLDLALKVDGTMAVVLGLMQPHDQAQRDEWRQALLGLQAKG